MSKSAAFILVCILPLISAQAMADTLYQPTLHLLTTKGTYESDVLVGGNPAGVSLGECMLRIEAWKSKYGAGMDVAAETLKEQGKTSAYSVECEPA